MEGRAGALDLLQYVGSFGGPDEGFGIVVVVIDVVEDRRDQILDAAKDPAAQAVGCEVAEETLHPCSAMSSR